MPLRPGATKRAAKGERLTAKLEPIKSVPAPSRVSVHIMAHYQSSGDKPHSIQTFAQKITEEKDEAFSHRVELEEAWIPIDMGWLKDCAGLICIENLEGRAIQHNLSDDEHRELELHVIEVAFDEARTPAIEITPTWPQYFFPTNPKSVYVRCRHNTALCRITVFPR